MKLYDKVIFTQEWDAYPHTKVKKGETGFITAIEKDGRIDVMLDNHDKGLDEWDNQILLYPEDRNPLNYIELMEE